MKIRTRLARTPWPLLSVGLVFAMGCSSSGGGSGPGGGGSSSTQGTFIDSPVEGLAYASGNTSGVTNAQGTFNFEKNTAVEFKVGDIVIGQAMPQKIMTPIALVPGAFDVTHQAVTNIARFMQTIDDDGDPTNGIKISSGVHSAAAGKSMNFDQNPSAFDQDTNVQSVVSDLTTQTSAGQRSLVGAQAAQDHLRGSLVKAHDGSYSGRACHDATGQGGSQTPAGNWTMTLSNGTGSVNFTGLGFNVPLTVDEYGGVSGTNPAGDQVFGQFDADGKFFGRYYRQGGDSGSFSETTNCTGQDGGGTQTGSM